MEVVMSGTQCGVLTISDLISDSWKVRPCW